MAVTEQPVVTTAARYSPPEIARRAGIHYGWVMVGITFLLVTVTAGIRSAPGVMITPLEDDFGWSTTQISLAISISILTLGLAGPISGRLIDRHGTRPVILSFLVLGTLGVIATWTLQSLWQFYIFWGFMVGFGAGGTSIVLSATVANTWFQEKRGLVTGVLGGAASAGQLVFILALAFVVDAWGWRTAIGLMAILAGCIVLPAALLLLRSRPSDVGLTAYGSHPGDTVVASDERLVPMSEALRSRDFWLLAVSFGVCGFTTIGLIGTAISSAGIPMMSAFAVVFGLDYIATVPPTVMLTANRFGRRSVGTIYGWITFSHMVGGAAAAALAGKIHDASGDYGMAMYLGGVLAVFAAAFAFRIGSRTKGTPGLTPAASY